MKRRRFSSKKRIQIPTKYILVALTFICVISMFLGLVFNVKGGPLSALAGYIFVPMQSGINNVGHWASDKVNNFQSLTEVIEENKKLQEQVDELTTKLTISNLESYEIDSYRELLDLDAQYQSYDKVAANVVAYDSGNWFNVFTINKGSNDGIEEGMNVIAGSGLVGIVTEVSPNFATIRSIIDDASNVSAMATTTGDIFNVSGNLETMGTNQVIEFNGLRDSENKVSIGDPVVTSYVSDIYNEGILIGYIESIENDANNLTKSGTITPVVDFEHVKVVFVILQEKEISD